MNDGMADANDNVADQAQHSRARPKQPFLKRGEGVEKRLTAYQRRKPRQQHDDTTSGQGGTDQDAIQAVSAFQHRGRTALVENRGRSEQHETDQELEGDTQLVAPDANALYSRAAAAAGNAAMKGLTPRGAAAVAATRASFGEPSGSSPWEAREAEEAWELEEFRALEKEILRDTGGMRASVHAAGQWNSTETAVAAAKQEQPSVGNVDAVRKQQQRGSTANGLTPLHESAHSSWVSQGRVGASAGAAVVHAALDDCIAQNSSASVGQPLDFDDDSEWVDAEVSFQGFSCHQQREQQHLQQQSMQHARQVDHVGVGHHAAGDVPQQMHRGSGAVGQAGDVPEQAFVRSLFKQAAQAKPPPLQAALPAKGAASTDAKQGLATGTPPEVLQRLQRLEEAESRSVQEKASLLRMRTELERAAQRLEAERSAWEQQKADEHAALAAAREDSERRLARERRVLDKQSKALLKLPSKKERDAVEALEAVLLAERKEARAAQARHKLTVERLRCQVKELQDKALELREEVRWHEAKQLAAQEFAAGGKGRPGSGVVMVNALCQTMPITLVPQPGKQPAAATPSSALHQPDWRPAAAASSSAPHANGNGWSQAQAAGRAELLQPTSSSSSAAMSQDAGSDGAADGLGELYAALFEGDEPYEDEGTHRPQQQHGQQQQQQQQRAERWLSDPAAPPMPASSSGSAADSTHRHGANGRAALGPAPGVAPRRLHTQQPDSSLHGGPSTSAAHGSVAGRRIVNTVVVSPAKPNAQQQSAGSQHMHGNASASSSQQARPSHAQPTHQQPQQREQPSTSGPALVREVRHTDGKVERHMSDGARVVVFANGTTKTTDPAGSSSIRFGNGDIKRSVRGGAVEYYYAEVDTWQTSYADGLEVYHFPSGQTEGHHPDGVKEIVFPDGAVRRVLPDGFELEITRDQLSSAVQAPRPTP